MATDAAAVIQDRDIFTAYLKGTEAERARESRNWRLYTAVDYGQWPEAVLRDLIAEKRPPTSYNFVGPTVDVLAGSLIVDPFEVRYEPEYGDEKNNGPKAMQALYVEDREKGDFMAEWLEIIRAGHVFRGWGEFYKDWDRREGRPSVGFRYRSGDGIITDPTWKSHKVNHNRSLLIWSRMTAEEMADKYNTQADAIRAAIDLQKQFPAGVDPTNTESKLFELNPEFFDAKNGLYLVMDRLWLKKRKKVRLFDADEIEMLPEMSQEDMARTLESAKVLGRNIEIITTTETVCMVRTTAPGLSLSLVLQEGPHPLQLGGYPYICFSSNCPNGVPVTPCDQLYDAQVTFNKRQSIFTHALQVNANQELLIESDATENPDDVHKIGKNRRPGGYHIVEPGANNSNKVKPLTTGGTGNMDYSAAANDVLANIYPRLTANVPATSGMQEQSSESGVLFQSKVAQAQVGMQISNRYLRAAWNAFGELYFAAAKQVYTYPMELSSVDENFWLNVPGGIYLKDLPRMKVTVTQAPISATMRQVIQAQFMGIAQHLDPITKQAMSRIVLKHLPNVPSSELEELERTARLGEEIGKREATLKLLQLDDALGQAGVNMGTDFGGAPAPGPQPGAQAPPPEPGQSRPGSFRLPGTPTQRLRMPTPSNPKGNPELTAAPVSA